MTCDRRAHFSLLGALGLAAAGLWLPACGTNDGNTEDLVADEGTTGSSGETSQDSATPTSGGTNDTSDPSTASATSPSTTDSMTTGEDDTTSSTTGDSSGSTGDEETTGEETTGDTGGNGLPPTSPACGQALDQGWLSNYQLEWGAWTQATQVQVGGVMRDYIVVLPENYDPDQAYPVHIVFHAWTGNMDNAYGLRVENRWDEPVIAIAPQGQPVQGGGYGWEWWETQSIDYDFVDALIHDVGDHACVDNQRIFASGTSNGAYMANMVACLTGWIRGVGASAGGMPIATGACAGPVTAFLMHGTADTVVPISEGADSRDAWLSLNGCSESSQSAVNGQCERYSDCTSGDEVYWCVHNGGHPESSPNTLGLSEPMISVFQSL